MGWITKLRTLIRGNTPTARHSAPAQATYGVRSNSANTPSIQNTIFSLGDFIGLHAHSLNERWVVAWMDCDSNRHGGNRQSGLGRYLLFDRLTRQVVARGSMPRPNLGRVADNGIFCLADQHFGSGLSGTFSVFDSSGNTLYSKDVTANILITGISPLGKYAVFHTANSSTEDRTKLFLIDVGLGLMIFATTPLAGWPQRYEIDDETGDVIAHIRDLGAYRYNRHGEFIDANTLEKDKSESPRYELALPALENMLKPSTLTREQAKEALDSVLMVREQGIGMSPSWEAKSWKLEGIAHEALGNNEAAVEAFDKALALDPKVGVKRKRATLQRLLTKPLP